MPLNLLILGGTSEASALARACAERGLPAVFSYAGRVERPNKQPVPIRTGGFGGPEGLAAYLRDNKITHLIDATHPFAAQISRNAIAAARIAEVPLIAFVRPPWKAQAGDDWREVADHEAAVAALAGPARRVMLALGRKHMAAFAAQPQHFYLLRIVDPLDGPAPLPNCEVLVSRGPFTAQDDEALLKDHAIDLIVARNAGGAGAQSKIIAARKLGLPVILIARPEIPPRPQAGSLQEVLAWIDHSNASSS